MRLQSPNGAFSFSTLRTRGLERSVGSSCNPLTGLFLFRHRGRARPDRRDGAPLQSPNGAFSFSTGAMERMDLAKAKASCNPLTGLFLFRQGSKGPAWTLKTRSCNPLTGLFLFRRRGLSTPAPLRNSGCNPLTGLFLFRLESLYPRLTPRARLQSPNGAFSFSTQGAHAPRPRALDTLQSPNGAFSFSTPGPLSAWALNLAPGCNPLTGLFLFRHAKQRHISPSHLCPMLQSPNGAFSFSTLYHQRTT